MNDIPEDGHTQEEICRK